MPDSRKFLNNVSHQSGVEERRGTRVDAALPTQPIRLSVLLLGDAVREEAGQTEAPGDSWGLSHLSAGTLGPPVLPLLEK